LLPIKGSLNPNPLPIPPLSLPRHPRRPFPLPLLASPSSDPPRVEQLQPSSLLRSSGGHHLPSPAPTSAPPSPSPSSSPLRYAHRPHSDPRGRGAPWWRCWPAGGPRLMIFPFPSQLPTRRAPPARRRLRTRVFFFSRRTGRE
jgi:hypothetical protein